MGYIKAKFVGSFSILVVFTLFFALSRNCFHADPIYSSGLYLALGSAEFAAQCIDDALKNDDISAARLGRFEPALWKGVDVVRRLIHAFYDPAFSFPKFAERFPEHRAALIDCLVGDVIKDMSAFTAALAQMTPPPPPLGSNIRDLELKCELWNEV